MESNDGSSRDTSVLVVTLESSEVYIIVSLSTRKDTQVIYIDPTTGSLRYRGKPGFDLFSFEEEAVKYLTDGSRFMCKTVTYARAILGYAALGNIALLLVATKLSPTVPNLPGGGCIYTVVESEWIKIQLQIPQPQGKGELKNISELAELDIDGKHYFCETRDITRPFPSPVTCHDPDAEFVWNGWFSKPFSDIGLPKHCVILLQGFAERRSIGGSSKGASVALLARRSIFHPGTRYLARGINACSGTGNEVECEQLVWISNGQKTPFSSYVWRRGTIPIWWGAKLNNVAKEAEIYVSENPYRGSVQYYERLSRRYSAKDPKLSTMGQRKTPLVPIICVNLLRYGDGKPETILVEHFKESIKYIKSTGKLPSTWIQLINYDWHATVKSNGEQETVEGLWKLLKAPTIAIGFCEGNYFSTVQRLKESKGLVVCSDDFVGGFCLKSLQNGVVRFNCADSLDRTNAASYFGAVQVFVEQCSRLGISLDNDSLFGFSSGYEEGGKGGTLPRGWEERFDATTGKPFYIDHNTRRTTWEHPCPEKRPIQEKPWKRFDMLFDQFKNSTMLPPVNQLADLFLLAGDIHATLYTGSKAMHSQILKIFSDDAGGKYSGLSVAQNVKISIQRRYKNSFVDSSRQKQLEMFLGIRLFKHLPSIYVHPLKVPSRPSGCVLKPIPSIVPITDGGSSLLSFKKKELIWVCPPDADVIELFIYLGEPCHVTHLLLTVSHGIEDSSYPTTVDVRTGCDLDGLNLVLEGACIPQCSNGTNLLIPLTGRIDPEDMAITGNSASLHGQDNSCLPLMYNFEELEGEINFLTRIVALTFYPSAPGRPPLTLGEIEVLGVSLPWKDIFSKNMNGAKFIKYFQETQEHSTGISHGSFSSSARDLQSSQSSAVSHGIDLLTGDLLSLESSDNPESSSGTEDNVQQLERTSNSVDQACGSRNTDDGTIQSYIDVFKSFSTSNRGNQLDFLQAMKLEIERLRLNISAAERDKALLSISIDPASIDPNRLLDDLYMAKVCNYAGNLALLGQTAFEDQIISSTGLGKLDDSVIDFWNISNFGETCSGTTCEVRDEAQLPTNVSSSSRLILECSKCRRRTCKVCCAGKGASLLVNSSSKNGVSGGSSHGGLGRTYSRPSELQDEVICKSCCSEVILYALYVDYMRVLSSVRRQTRADSAAHRAANQITRHDFGSISNSWQDQKINKKLLNKLCDGEESLAEFPYAGLLHLVETAPSSEPLLSLLAPLCVGEKNSFWRAPSSSSTVELSIILGGLSDVSGVTLIVSSCGYSTSDCPLVQIWASNKIHREERTCLGQWDMQSLISSSPHLCGQEKASNDNDVPRHVKFHFRNPVRCWIIWITLTLPQTSSPLNLVEQYDLFSLDENPFAKPNNGSSDSSVKQESFIHAKRLMVFGSSVKSDIGSGASLQNPEMMKMRSYLDRSPQLGRFRVPVEGERLTDNDLVLEQYPSPNMSGLAGFRLDAFNVIKPRIVHSPSSSDVDIWQSSLTRLDDRHISPAVLYIQVSAVQDSRKYVIVGEYRLPEVRAGTALYFDFPRPIQARRIVFRLLGDVSAFQDDISELDDSNFSLASGLSLSNKIKLYYYADPYELGKMGSLSAV